MIALFLLFALNDPWKVNTSISSEDLEYHYVAIGSKTIYALDAKDGVVVEYSLAGEELRRFGEKGPGPGELQNPFDIIEVKEGELWVCHNSGRTVSVFSQGVHARDFETSETVMGSVGTENVVVLVPSDSTQLFSIRDLSGKEIGSFRLPEHELSLPKGVRLKPLWYQVTASSYGGQLALSWLWLQALGSIDLNGQNLRIWKHDLYPASRTMKSPRGPIPLSFTGRTIVTGPNGKLLVGTCEGSSSNCKEILVLDLKNRKLINRISYPTGVAQLHFRHGVFVILTMKGTIDVIDIESASVFSQKKER